MSISWSELPSDFVMEPLSALFRQLTVLDALSLLQYKGGADVLVLLDEIVERQVLAYVGNRSFESGGLLLGKTYANVEEWGSSIKYVVVVVGCVCADEAHGTATALRMEPPLWTKANRSRKSDEFVVGWFHSHPNLGAFFSGTDRRTQGAFFVEPHKLGWVVDPFRKEEAWFSGKDSAELDSRIVIRGCFH